MPETDTDHQPEGLHGLAPSTRALYGDLQRLLLSRGGQYLVAPDPGAWDASPCLVSGGRGTGRSGILLVPWDDTTGVALEAALGHVLSQCSAPPSLCVVATSTFSGDPAAAEHLGQALPTPLVITDAVRRQAYGAPKGVQLVQGVFDERVRGELNRADPPARLAEQVAESRDQQTFGDLLRRSTRAAFVTPTLIGVNVLIFILMAVAGVGPLTPSSAGLVRWGAEFGPLTVEGEWWRLLTSCFVHIGPVHILFNMWCLWVLGQLAERLLGNVAFVVLYLACGLGGSIASVCWNPTILSAGASGAVFGLCGGLIGFCLARRRDLPPATFRAIMSSSLKFVAYNVIFGLAVRFINNAAHLGGLFTGVMLGAILSRALPPRPSRWSWARYAVAVAVTAALVVGGGHLARQRYEAKFGPGKPAPRPNLACAATRVGSPVGAITRPRPPLSHRS